MKPTLKNNGDTIMARAILSYVHNRVGDHEPLTREEKNDIRNLVKNVEGSKNLGEVYTALQHLHQILGYCENNKGWRFVEAQYTKPIPHFGSRTTPPKCATRRSPRAISWDDNFSIIEFRFQDGCGIRLVPNTHLTESNLYFIV